MPRKLKTLIAASAVAAAVGGVAAAPASAALVYSFQDCSAIGSDDGHRLTSMTCGTRAPGNYFVFQITVCNTSSCRLVSTPAYRQGTVHSFTTGGYIAKVTVGTI